MDEVITPALMDYQTEQYYFNSITVQRMELLFYGRNLSSELLTKSVGFILLILRDINMVEFRASMIAYVAVLAAIDQKLTTKKKVLESRMKSVSSSGLVETELVYSCY
ncbi:hypothetical protein IEQ34_001127 [Dendrobium chrysotoxum]|uniref:Uncharacterized protein n=1 Tax=Dendrobium chrysotoxum TaxID=161865 RepID=A0AAV7HMT7_DENCH|nr:hypothetical protein IEQ34_001127 [Dendrobium chrysotoxum]